LLTGHEWRQSVFKKQPALVAEKFSPLDASTWQVGTDFTDEPTVSLVENGASHLANRIVPARPPANWDCSRLLNDQRPVITGGDLS